MGSEGTAEGKLETSLVQNLKALVHSQTSPLLAYLPLCYVPCAAIVREGEASLASDEHHKD